MSYINQNKSYNNLQIRTKLPIKQKFVCNLDAEYLTDYFKII